MTPELDYTEIIPFFSLSPNSFERLCCDIVATEYEIEDAILYGRSGQKDFGVDIVSFKKDSNSLILVQCKRWKKCTPYKLKTTIQEFFRHWERWSLLNPTKYILCIGCEIDDYKTVDELIIGKKKFEEKNMRFELWTAMTLQRKLSRQQKITRKYIRNKYWQNIILGEFSEKENLNFLYSLDLENPTRQKIWRNLNRSTFFDLMKTIKSFKSKSLQIQLFEDIFTVTNSVCGKEEISPSDSLVICNKISHQFLSLDQWELRRGLGLVIGKSFNNLKINRSSKYVSSNLIRQCLDSEDGKVALAIASAQNYNSARLLGRKRIIELIKFDNPQVKWEIIRKWHIFSSIVNFNDIENVISNSSNLWVRRRLITSLASISFNSSTSKNKHKNIIIELLKKETNNISGERYTKALISWIHKKAGYEITSTGISIIKKPLELEQNFFNFNEDKTYESIINLANSLDFACLNLAGDLFDSRFQNTKSSEGRYGTIKSWLKDIIQNSDGEILSLTLLELLKCIDEGVRWSIANLASIWAGAISTASKYEIIKILIKDSHPWVFREIVKRIISQEVGIYGPSLEKIIKLSNDQIKIFSSQGWNEDDFKFAHFRLVSMMPISVSPTINEPSVSKIPLKPNRALNIDFEELIFSGNERAILENVITFTQKNSEMYNLALMLKIRYNSLLKDQINGIITYDELVIQRNKINKGILDLVGMIMKK